jgi:hypothetical protein
MRVSLLVVATIATFSAALSGSPSYADDFSARLSGFEEVGALPTATSPGLTGAILSQGTGKLRLDLDREFATYKLTYSGLGSAVTQAHIHFGKRHVPGGISVFLCTNLGNGPAGTPACPNPTPGGPVTLSVSGTLSAASVVGPAAQNVHPNVFADFANIVKSNTAYANIHTAGFPAGEIRGQVRDDEHDDD